MANTFLKAVFVALGLGATNPVLKSVQVQTRFATLTGCIDPLNGLDVFTGIPYAQPPIGKLRLQPPKAIQDDQGSVDVSSDQSYACFGLGAQRKEANEDCLTLDLVRPHVDLDGNGIGNHSANATENGWPVYLFIHGGDFNSGDKSDYDGRALVKASVQLGSPMIYVTLNYRLSFLGFPNSQQVLQHNATNLGLLDQRLALDWLSDNLASFGGDPTKVTIGGQNSGAISCAFHMTANGGQTGGLFRGAIMESGGATSNSPIPYSNYTEWSDPYSAILALTGCNAAPDSFLCLQYTPISKLATAYNGTYTQMRASKPSSVYMPIVDGKFLAKYPSTLLSQGEIASIPTLVGTTTNELVDTVPIYNGLGTDSSLTTLYQQMYPYVSASTLQQIMTYYLTSKFQNVGPPLSGAQWSRAVAIQNDISMFCPMYDQALATSKAPTWKFRWNAVQQSTPVNQWEGVPQGSELPYLFPGNQQYTALSNPADQALAKELQRRIISFVNTLDPNSLSSSSAVKWPEYSVENQTRLVFQKSASGLGLHVEVDNVDKSACDYIRSKNTEFLR